MTYKSWKHNMTMVKQIVTMTQQHQLNDKQ